MLKILLLSIPLFILISCDTNKNKVDRKALENEVINTEKEFNNLLIKEGAAVAFYTFASDNAVIKRQNDSLIIGKDAIKNYYSQSIHKNSTATWTPTFIDLSKDGSMAYTYGNYTWTMKDSLGESKEFKGVFHTVWKKMDDGKWKYVWD